MKRKNPGTHSGAGYLQAVPQISFLGYTWVPGNLPFLVPETAYGFRRSDIPINWWVATLVNEYNDN